MNIQKTTLFRRDLAEQQGIGRIAYVYNMHSASAFAGKISDAIDDHDILKSATFRRVVMPDLPMRSWRGNINDHHAATTERYQVRKIAFATDVGITIVAVERIEMANQFDCGLGGCCDGEKNCHQHGNRKGGERLIGWS